MSAENCPWIRRDVEICKASACPTQVKIWVCPLLWLEPSKWLCCSFGFPLQPQKWYLQKTLVGFPSKPYKHAPPPPPILRTTVCAFPALNLESPFSQGQACTKDHRLSRTWGDELWTPPSRMSSLFFWPLISADGGFSRAPSRFPLKTIQQVAARPPPIRCQPCLQAFVASADLIVGDRIALAAAMEGGAALSKNRPWIPPIPQKPGGGGGGFTNKMGHPPIKII